MGLFDKIAKNVADAATSATNSAVTGAQAKKYEFELADLNAKYDECYIIIGKRISESLRNGEQINDARVTEAFKRIQGFDEKKAEVEAKLRALRGEKSALTEAEKLVAIETDAEKEIEKLKSLLELGVDSQDEFDRKVAALRNKVIHFKKIDALDQALSKGLINEDVYKSKKAAILGQDIVESKFFPKIKPTSLRC